MIESTHRRKHLGREALVWLSFAAFLMASMGFGSIFIFRDLPTHLGIDMQRRLVGWEILWVAGIVLVVEALLVYLGAIAWLLFARLFFSKAEVSKLVFYGPATRLDRWLLDVMFRETR
jgi:hypothetical protein